MRLQEDLDFTTLNWVKQELDETLKQARQSLEAFVEEPEDASLMRFCATYLHQVQGTLRMVELYGAAMVAEEMERLANGLLENQIRQKDEGYAVLMRGIVQLPDYLERLQSGHKDIPIVLLPLLNDLRACRGEKLLSESVLFSPDLSAAMPRGAQGPERPMPELELRQQAVRLRTQFQVGLLNWIKENHPEDAIAGLIGTLDKLRAITTQEAARRLWWIAAGLLDAVRLKSVETSTALKSLFGRVDREIKRLADSGEPSFRVETPRELTKNLLYYVAYSTANSDRVAEIRSTYKLDLLLPSQQELEHAKGSLAGRNRALLDTVSAAIKDDLLRVKDVLDMHLRSSDSRPEELGTQTEVLDRVADTLGMLGLGVPRRVVQDQALILGQLASGARKVDETVLLDIAGALLYVEASLDDNIQTLGGSAEPEPAVSSQSAALELPQTEVRRILDALMKEAMTNLQQAKQDIVAFVESPWDHAKVTGIPHLMEEISGALRMLALEEPAALVDGLVRFVAVELIRLKRVPTPDQMDRLADALASVEYYLEAARDQRSGREKILDVTRRSLEALGYWPVPAEALAIELDEITGPAPVKAAPATVPVLEKKIVAEPPPSSSTDVNVLSFGTAVEGSRAAHAMDGTESAGDISEHPAAFEIPGAGMHEALARIDSREDPPSVAPALPPTATPVHELSTVVEISRGRDLGDLALGQVAATPVEPPPPPHDLAGLRFAETTPLAAVGESEDDYEWIEVEEEVEADAEPTASPLSDSSFQAVHSDDIDDEIREVFVEEVQEEIDNVSRALPVWKSEIGDLERLKPIRRSFHTLKGSGRLVGALALGEFSWKVENMLNRILDKSISAGPAVTALLEHAIGVLPQLLSALRGEGAPKSDLAQIMAVADQLANGETAWVSAPQRVMVKKVTRVRVAKVKPVPVVAPVELTIPLDITRAIEVEPEQVLSSSTITAVSLPPIEVDAPVATVPQLDSSDLALPELDAPSPVVSRQEASCATVPVLDAMLLEILRSEVEGHVAVLRAYLDDCARAGVPIEATEVLLRAVHTMHGALSMAEVPVLNDVVGPLETYLKRLRSREAAPSAEGVASIRLSADLIDSVIRVIDQPGHPLPDPQELAAQVTALRDDLPEPSNPLTAYVSLMDEVETGPTSDIDSELQIERMPQQVPAPTGAETLDASAASSEPIAESPETSLEAALAGFDAIGEPIGDALPAEEAAFLEALAPTAPVQPAAPSSGEFAAFEAMFAQDALAQFEVASATLASETDQKPDDQKPAQPLLADLDFGNLDGDLEAPSDTLAALDADSSEADELALFAAPLEPVSELGSDQLSGIEAALGSIESGAAVPAPAAPSTSDEFDDFFLPEFTEDAAPVEPAHVEPTAAVQPAAPTDVFFEFDAIEALDLPAVPQAQEALLADPPRVLEPFDQPLLQIDESLPSAAFAELEEIQFDAIAAPMVVSEVQPEQAESAAVGALAAVSMPSVEPEPVERAATEMQTRAPLEDPDPDLPLDLPDLDEDLLEIFVEEGHEILHHADGLVAKLREPDLASDAIAGLKRHLHTLKGNARAVGVVPIGDLSHAVESVLEAVTDDRIVMDRHVVIAMERSFDRLHHMVDRVTQRRAVGMPAQTIVRLEALASGKATVEPEPLFDLANEVAPAADELVATTVAPSAVEPSIPAIEPASAEVDRPRAAPARPLPSSVLEEEVTLRAPQEMIRVRSDLLDALVNFAGEVSIYRSRLEQQMVTFRFNLVELDQTVTRLRDQLRKLEIETEAQIIARFQREGHDNPNAFDPLELDQFSNVQQLSRALAESVADLVALQGAMDDLTRQSETLLLQQSRVSSELQEGLMRTRMVPFDSIVPFLRRLVRQTSDMLGKRATLRVEGAQGEMDRNLLERMKAPFEHMLRNAIDHGIELPEQRVANGKPEEGTVRIHVSREATEVVIRVSDDGRGMNREAIRKKAIERGLMRPDAQMSDRDLFGFVLETGFSTAEKLTQTSGRGVGMDVVGSEIKQLGGSLAIDSKAGVGSTFMVRLPFTLAVTQAIMIRLADQMFAIPMASVQGVARIPRDDLDRRLKTAHPTFSYAGEEYTIHELNSLLGLPTALTSEMGQLPLLLTRSGDQRGAIRVDAVLGSREIVVKSAGPQVNSVSGIFGATILGDGSVVMILDFNPLVRRSAALREEGRVSAALEEAIPGFLLDQVEPRSLEPAPTPERRRSLVMVVDDSITMRKVTGRVLERNDMEVVTAKDGLDAVEKLQERVPDLMLLDIEMPRMDGYELATYMRNDSRLKGVPIIMITSRTGEKHRQRALEIGVERYMGKPYQEADLLRNVQEILGISRVLH